MNKDRFPAIIRILVSGFFFVILYVGSYAVFYTHARPAANLAYWVYLPGEATQSEESVIYDFYYPIYKIHRMLGGPRHNYDRGIDYNHIYDGDEPTNNASQ